MNPRHTVSVALCTYNGERFLKEQLDSIRAQTRPPDELIVCDDGSSDSTLEIVRRFQETSPFPVKVAADGQHRSVTKNFERAISLCSGDIIFLADQDDVWKTGKVERMLQAFDENPGCGYVFSNADLIDESGKPLGADLWQSIGFGEARRGAYESGDPLGVMLRDGKGNGNFIYGTTLAFRSLFKPALLPIASKAFDCTHDTWIALMLSAQGAYGVALREKLVEYRQHARQVAGAGQKQGPAHFIQRMFLNKCAENPALAEALESIAARLPEGRKDSPARLGRERLTDKAGHLRARFLAGSSRGLPRLKHILREVGLGRYRRFSGGLKSAFKDLVAFPSQRRGKGGGQTESDGRRI